MSFATWSVVAEKDVFFLCSFNLVSTNPGRIMDIRTLFFAAAVLNPAVIFSRKFLLAP
jgi:hypothetical protein